MQKGYFLLLTLIVSGVSAQQSHKAKLNFQSSAYSFDVTSSGKMMIATRMGEAAFAQTMDSLWTIAYPAGKKEDIVSSTTIDNVNFFNADTGIVSGFINNKNKYEILYRTTDGGKNWQAVNMGQDGWVDDASHLENGEAWLSVSGSGIAYTNDFGRTWQKIKIPDIKQRFAHVFFNSSHQGLIGSLWNMLAYTDNNGNDWKQLPTPLDQHKYSKTNSQNRPEFSKVAIYRDVFIVQQEELVFWSKKDSINWQLLKEYNNFYTDAENSNLYFKTKKGSIIHCKNIIDTVTIFQADAAVYNGVCRKGKLYLQCDDKIIKLHPDQSQHSAVMYTDAEEVTAPSYFAYTEMGSLGNIGNKVYRQKGIEDKWEYLFDLPFEVNENGSLSLWQKTNLIYNTASDTAIYYDVKKKLVTYRSKPQMLNDFVAKQVTQITFNSGSSGCFHNYNNSKVYIRESDGFNKDESASVNREKRQSLPECDDNINETEVDSFTNKIPELRGSLTTIEDLEFTPAEFAQCKKDILMFKSSVEKKTTAKENGFQMHENEIDFDKLLNCVDSIKLISPERLTPMLYSLSDMWSTTTNWLGFNLENEDGDVLAISNRSSEFNYYFFPWIVEINGVYFTTTSVEINRFLKKVYPALIKGQNKMEVLYTLVKQLYRE